jgi:hypothetical protein
MVRRIAGAVVALGVLLVLSGCNLAAKVVVEPDGSGYYSVIMTVPKGSSDAGEALYRALQQGATQSDIPLTVAPYSSGDSSGGALTFHFLSLADLDAESRRLAAAHVGGIGVTIERDSTGWHFSTSTTQTIFAPSSAGADETGGAINTSQLNSLISIDLVVQLPGAPAANNAKTVTHTATASTFTWVLSSIRPGTVVQASTTYVGNQANVKLATSMTPVAAATSSNSGAGSGWSAGMMALVALGAVVVLGAGALIVIAQRRKAVPAVEDAAATG